MNDARHLHRLVYGGLGNAHLSRPEELGHAAAYEAYRTWMHNSSMYEPLSGDIERQREALIGLAVAEAYRLLSYSGRNDRMQASEAAARAAATASVIFSQNRGMDIDGGYRSRSRAGSFSGSYGSPYVGVPFPGGGDGSGFGDAYAYDERIMRPRHHSHRHSRSHSRSRHHSSTSPIIVAPARQYGYATNPMAIPGTVPSQSYGTYGSYAGYRAPYVQQSPGYAANSVPGYGYAGSPVAIPATASTTMLVPSHRRPRSSSSHHHHHHRHHGRPRSADPYGYVRY